MSVNKYRKKNVNRSRSSLTRLAFYIGMGAALVEIYLGIRYLFISPDEGDRLFGTITIMEGTFALIGLYVIDLLRGKKATLWPKEFEKMHPNTILRVLVIAVTLMVTQAIFQFVPLTVREYERAAAIIFAGPAEELFFRGVIFGSFMKLGENAPQFEISEKRKISGIEIIGIFISAVFFAMIHVNYYGDWSVMMAVFTSGVILALFYWLWKDITALILAHFLINIVTVIQVFWMVSF